MFISGRNPECSMQRMAVDAIEICVNGALERARVCFELLDGAGRTFVAATASRCSFFTARPLAIRRRASGEARFTRASTPSLLKPILLMRASS